MVDASVVRYRSGAEILRLRKDLGLSRSKFAIRFGFNLVTLRQWEEGRRSPDAAARTLLVLVAHSPEVIERLFSEAILDARQKRSTLPRCLTSPLMDMARG